MNWLVSIVHHDYFLNRTSVRGKHTTIRACQVMIEISIRLPGDKEFSCTRGMPFASP